MLGQKCPVVCLILWFQVYSSRTKKSSSANNPLPIWKSPCHKPIATKMDNLGKRTRELFQIWSYIMQKIHKAHTSKRRRIRDKVHRLESYYKLRSLERCQGEWQNKDFQYPAS